MVQFFGPPCKLLIIKFVHKIHTFNIKLFHSPKLIYHPPPQKKKLTMAHLSPSVDRDRRPWLSHDCWRMRSYRRHDSTRQLSRVGVGGVYWALNWTATPSTKKILTGFLRFAWIPLGSSGGRGRGVRTPGPPPRPATHLNEHLLMAKAQPHGFTNSNVCMKYDLVKFGTAAWRRFALFVCFLLLSLLLLTQL